VKRWLLLVPAVALLALFNVQRAREADQLAACRGEADEQVAHLVAKALSVEQYAGPQLTAASTPPSVRASLEQLVTGTVARELPQVLAARERCGFRTLPWSGTADRRDAYVADLDRRIAVLQRATQDRDALHDQLLFSP
jgi:hypothetical protein